MLETSLCFFFFFFFFFNPFKMHIYCNLNFLNLYCSKIFKKKCFKIRVSHNNFFKNVSFQFREICWHLLCTFSNLDKNFSIICIFTSNNNEIFLLRLMKYFHYNVLNLYSSCQNVIHFGTPWLIFFFFFFFFNHQFG